MARLWSIGTSFGHFFGAGGTRAEFTDASCTGSMVRENFLFAVLVALACGGDACIYGLAWKNSPNIFCIDFEFAAGVFVLVFC